MSASASAAAQPRALCPRCRRPARVCVCAHLPALTSGTRVVILQHPRESDVAIGTARMASRSLHGSCVVVGTHVETHPTVARALADPERRPVLLWPGPAALDLATSPPTGPLTLFVVDGTWSLAKKLIKLNPAIAALPRYKLSPSAPSEYRIRREPRAECLSTIEALANALGVLEGDPEPYRALLTPFRAMVDAQLAYMTTGRQPRFLSRSKRARRPAWKPPHGLRDPSRVVVVAAETNAWPCHAKQRYPDEIVQWLAVRGDESRDFAAVVRPSHPLAPGVVAHTELAADLLLAGTSRPEFLAAFDGFLGAGDAIATWGTYATRLMAEAGLARHRPVIDLRRVAADWLRASPGSIDACLAGMGLSPAPRGPGRGGRRLGQMLAVYRQVLEPRP
jgi:DTW domain-containing protein